MCLAFPPARVPTTILDSLSQLHAEPGAPREQYDLAAHC